MRSRDLPTLPLWDLEYVTKTMKMQNQAGAIDVFLHKEAPFFGENQTLVFDSMSTIGDSVADNLWNKAPKSKTGEPDGYWFWDEWSSWWLSFCTKLMRLRCNVVVICHEQEIRDAETGRVLAYKWMLKGKDFSPRLGQFFTDVFRMTRKSTEQPGGKVAEEYLWQVKPDDKFPFCCTRMSVDTKFVQANYTSFEKYGLDT